MNQPAKPSRMPISVGSLLWIALIVWLVMPSPQPTVRQMDALRAEVSELRREISLLRTSLSDATAGSGAPSHPTAAAAIEPTDPDAARAANSGRGEAATEARSRASSTPDDAVAPSDPETLAVERE